MFPPSVTDTQAIQFVQHFCDRLLQRLFDRRAQAAARLERFSLNPHEEHICGRDSEEFGAEQRVDQRWRVRIHAHGGTVAHDVCLAIKLNRSHICVVIYGIDQDDSIFSRELIDQVKGRGPQIGDFDALFELLVGGQKPRDIRSDTVIPQQDVSDSANQHLLHSTFTLAIWRPDGSKVWQAQAMQGSKECTVRKTSNGSSGRASGVCSSEAS
jgi:hypothetical protein